MVVVPFPGRARALQGLPASPLSSVITALYLLGEPATIDELSNLIEASSLQFGNCNPAKVRAVLGLHDEQTAGGGFFRRVEFRGGEGWAFTATFRVQMREAGLPANLRPLDGEGGEADPTPGFAP